MTLTGDDEYSISDRSSLGLFEGIHQALESSARLNWVSSSEITKSPSAGCAGSSYRNPMPSLKARTTKSNLRPGAAVSATDTRSSLWWSRTCETSPQGWVQVWSKVARELLVFRRPSRKVGPPLHPNPS